MPNITIKCRVLIKYVIIRGHLLFFYNKSSSICLFLRFWLPESYFLDLFAEVMTSIYRSNTKD